jgi:hypothetical protein
MSDEQAKVKHSKRLQQKENHVQKQVKILKEYVHEPMKDLKEPHRLAKRHAMNCGNPKCLMCANPRKTFKELTIQEQREHQELEIARGRHSNGLVVDEIEEYLKVRNGDPATY